MKHPKQYDSTKQTRTRMSKVHLKGGHSERMLALALWHADFRYRLNDKALPGSPDIAIQRFHIAVFVDGEFWHGKDWADKKSKLKRNRDYWIKKIEENMSRDERDDRALQALGWKPVHFWEQMVLHHLDYCVDIVQYYARSDWSPVNKIDNFTIYLLCTSSLLL